MNIRERRTYLLGLSKDNRYFLCGALNASKATSPEEQAANLFSAGSWPWDGRAHLQCWCCSLNPFWEMSPRTHRLAPRTYSGLPLFPCVKKKTSSHIKFLADIEIYVDGIATMQIQNLNTLVDTVRHEIIERYRPGEDDPHLKVLQAAHISDDEYFSHMVLDDLNLIIRDIRETHKKDSESAPQTTVANELKENLEAIENFKGSRLEKLAVLYCKQLGINYKNLSDEEFRWLIRILQKSKKTGTPINQRKKR